MSTYPAATQHPGPPSKTGYPGLSVNACTGVACHSMVGYVGGALAELDKLERRASWHFSVLRDGTVLQHYDSTAIAWHAGSPPWNTRLIGIEHEGGFSPTDEPLTPAQLAASVTLVRWLSATHGFPLRRGDGLWEHHEIAPATDPTSCPSGRIPWAAYTEERMPTPEYDELKQADKDIETILARVDGAVKFLISLSLGLATQVYGDSDPKTIDLRQRVDALEKQ